MNADPAAAASAPVSERLAMFPLGSVLLPTMVLPLHVFEPRYRRLLADVGADGRFGVTMIERGPEVGGGDVRSTIGCVARIVSVSPLPGDRFDVVAVGGDRVRVSRWLDDDPYPRAEVTVMDEPPPLDPDDPAWTALELAFRSLLDRLVARGAPVDPDVQLAPDPALATYQMAAIGPIGVLDRYHVLAALRPEERRELLAEAIHGVAMVLDADG